MPAKAKFNVFRKGREADTMIDDKNNLRIATVSKARLVEIDALRGLAVFAMVIYHFIYDLIYFVNLDFSLSHPLMRVLALAAYVFFFLFGLSSNFSKNPLKRVLKTGLAATAVSFVTYFLDPGMFVKFGTLHFLTLAGIVLYLCRNLKDPYILLPALISLLLGIYFDTLRVKNPWLFPFGLKAKSFTSLDYYPVFPNLFYALLGYVVGRKFYNPPKPRLPGLKAPFLSFLGRNALLIYLLHQPLLLLALQAYVNFLV